MKNSREFDQISLLDIFRNSSKAQVAAQLDRLVQFMGEQKFCQEAARHLVLFASPEIAIPGSLDRFAPLVREGIEFFLAGISYQRLRRVLLSLFDFRNSRDPGERLLHLALHFPTLHKLGQVVARNPHLDPKVKRWLVGLEQGNYGADPDVQIGIILEQLDRLEAPSEEIDISPHIIAEASVATVLSFCCLKFDESSSDGSGRGVFKVLKPGVQDDLREELDILADTFTFLDQNRKRYGLQEMKLTTLFEEIREDMAREVDLAAEQAHLAEAVKVYDKVTGVRIPKPAPFNTPTMTSMEFIDGMRIGDVDLTKQQRMMLARSLFEAIICVPLFMMEELALFHGDPHAGNILIVPGNDRKSFDVALLDWTLAGHLSKQQRVYVMELLLGIIKNDSRTLAAVIESFALESDEGMNLEHIAERIQVLLTTKDYLACDSLKKTFLLLETMTLEGVVFPSELILFRKSFFTLEGVLHDISEGFAMGEAMELYLAALLLKEMPQRYATLMIPADDKPEHYQTLLSNRALHELSLHQAIAFWQKAMCRNSALIETQIKLMTDFFMSFPGSHFWSGQKG
jgi:ubiquinone biosynthesis protein